VDTAQDRFDDVEAQATRWLVRLDAGRSPEVLASYEAWLAKSVRHKVAYAKQALAWKRMDILRRMRPLDRGGADPDLLRKKKRSWFGFEGVLAVFSRAVRPVDGRDFVNMSIGAKWLPKVVATAVVAALAAVGAALVLGGHDDDVHTYSTKAGDQLHVVLDDGSVIDLNTNTQIRVRFSAARRQILLDRGEALFSVAHDASRPFEVTALGVTARAVGTKFSVRLHEDARVETLVTEGRVLVLRQSELLGVPMAPRPIGHTLVAGEHVVVTKRAAVVSKVGPKEIDRQLRWTTGKVAFEEQPLADVVREVNRYTTRQLVIKDPGIVRTAVGGGFDTRNAEAYAADLVRFFGEKALAPVDAAPARR